MKKCLYLILAGLTFTAVQSQDASEALRYAQDDINGTARFRAMSGAFGALGGDFSSINVNPAGSAIFNYNQIAISLNNYDIDNTSRYFGTKTKQNNSTININQIGGVYVFENDDDKSDWKKFSLAMNYENTNNFNNSFFSEGVNPTNSIGNYFQYYANRDGGISLSNLQLQPGESLTDLYSYLGSTSGLGFGAQQALLGYQGFVIDPAADYDEANNRDYISLIPSGGNYEQQNVFNSNGYNGKLAFNFATQYKDKLYLGLNLNSHFTDYTQTTSFYEGNTNTPTAGVQRLRFDNQLYTYGSGFSFQLGAIAKASKTIRLGLAYESATWYELNDELTQRLAVESADASGTLPTDIVNPQVVNVYEPYRLTTPSKWTGSFAYVFGKRGLLSIDYATKDYSNTQYRPEKDFTTTNNTISNTLTRSGELRIGGEYKIKEWSLRAGYRYEESPYKDGKTVGDLTGSSLGFGYNFGNTRFDFALSHSERDSQRQFFSQGLTDRANINSVNNNVTITLVFAL